MYFLLLFQIKKTKNIQNGAIVFIKEIVIPNGAWGPIGCEHCTILVVNSCRTFFYDDSDSFLCKIASSWRGAGALRTGRQ